MPSTMLLIARQTLSVDTASVTFSNIPQTYTDLRLVVSARTDRANNGDSMYLQFNGDTTSANYSNRILYGTGSSAVSITSATAILLTQGACGSSDTANTFGSSEAYIPNYTGSTTKSVSHQGNSETNAATSYMSVDAGLWSGTAPITSMLLRPGNGTAFRSGSTFFLYGVTSAAGSIPGTFGVDATGGDVTISGGFKYHVFRSSGTFTVTQPGWVDYLVVAGGGGSGGVIGGGGGAGEYRAGSVVLPTGPSTVVVGAGGTGGAASDGAQGTNGTNSWLATLTPARGGGGGGSTYASGLPGGSGGGTSISNLALPASTASVGGFGNTGGNGNGLGGADAAAGGGGGAGAAGASASNLVGGNGGVGRQWLDGNFYAGGGGGSVQGTNIGNYTPGTGGAGGGGNASRNSAGSPGAANTGGGGGGSPGNPSFAGVSGGSGIVIIRYPVS